MTNVADGLGKSLWEGTNALIDITLRNAKPLIERRVKSGKDVRKGLVKFFENVGWVRKNGKGQVLDQPIIAKVQNTNYGQHMLLKLYPGLWIGDLFRMQGQLEEALGGEVHISKDTSDWIHLRIYTRKIPTSFEYSPVLAERVKKYPLALPVGVGREGLVLIQLWKDESFAMLVAGQPGGGKSSWVRQALFSTILNYSPEDVIMFLVDMKRGGVELGPFSVAPHVRDFGYTLNTAHRVLDNAIAELDYRASKIAKANVTCLEDYNYVMRGKNKMPHMLVVIDEWMTLDASSKDHTGCKEKALLLCQQGRAFGVHPIICTQHPSAKVITGEIRSLIPATLAFKTTNRRYSRMILGEERNQAAYLECAGRGILLVNSRLRKVQVMNLDPKKVKIEQIIKQKYKISKVVKHVVMNLPQKESLSW